MQTKPFADLTVNNAAQVNDAAPVGPTGPIELDLNALQFVTGGGTPRGGWSESLVAADTDCTPRGGW